MTNQEAIDELIIVRNVYDGMREAYKPCVEAIDMAISALQALDEIYAFIMKSEASETTDGVLEIFDALKAQDLQPNLQQTCNQLATDTISRQAAIDAVETKIKKWNAVDGEGYHVGLGLRYTDVIDTLTELPPAQPEPCEDAVSRNAIIQKLNTMDRYVSEELVLCDTDKRFPKNEVFIVDDVYEEIVENLPSAQPDLSGYSDRLWKAAYERGKAEAGIIHCGECKYYHDSDGCFFSTATTGADGFCHWAERKEGEADERPM